MNAVSISEFRKNMATYLEQVKYKRKPLLLGKRSNPDFVILPGLDKEEAEMYASKEFRRKVEEGREQVRQGKFYTIEEVEERLKSKKTKK